MPASVRSLSTVIEFPKSYILKKPPYHICSEPVQHFAENPPKHQQVGRPQSLDDVTYTKLLRSSITSGSLLNGKLAHAHMMKTAFEPSLFVQNNLVNMYIKCGDLGTAQQVFDIMPERNVVSWNSLISGYARAGAYRKALGVFGNARDLNVKINKFTYASMLSICAQTAGLEFGKMIHGLIIVSELGTEVLLTNSLVDMYSKCGRIGLARLVFDKSDELDDVSWNTLITGYAENGLTDEMLQVLFCMHRAGIVFSSYVLGGVLKACCLKFRGSLESGRMLHACAVKLGWDSDIIVGTALLDMYAKIGDLNDAISVFKVLPDKNVVMYNAMITGMSRAESTNDKFATEALNLFSIMQRNGMEPSKFTFSTIIKACIAQQELELGKQIHAHVCKKNLQSDEYIGSGLVELYSLFKMTEDGMKCFNLTAKQDIVTWTSIIMGLAQNEQFESALGLFFELLQAGIKPDEFTISTLLSICGNLAAARSGEQIQGYAIKSGINKFTVVENSVTYMYAKSGDIDSANSNFQSTAELDIVSWSVMICSTAQHGCAKEALLLFELMKGSGIAPNDVTFLGVLTACSHGGLVDQGFQYFESMKRDYCITPNEKHCVCIVDLLGRCGRLEDAESFILNSEFCNTPVMWRALLSSCRLHKDTIAGKRIAERVIELEPDAAASYVLLYNIYTEAGMEAPATEIRTLMKDRRVKKEPGVSWIEVGNRVHTFLAGDRSHPKSKIIYARLEEMLEKIKKIGYTNERLVSDAFRLEDKNNSAAVNHHSEKLAVALGIISLPPSAPIRVMKNLRVCLDCHKTMKLLSKVEKREIILRDSIRFHRFREGSCSCGDYW